MASRNPNCRLCPLHKTSKTVCVSGEGTLDADVMLIGEALGETEELEGRPFVGEAGGQLNALLAKAGMPRESVYISNVVKCRPPNNRPPTQDEIKACSGYLAEEIAQVHPKVIVALGGSSLSALSGKTKVGENRGKLLEPKTGIRLNGATIIATYHPAAFLHNRQQATLDAIVEDFNRAKRLAYPPAVVESVDTVSTRTLLYGEYLTTDNIKQALSIFENTKTLACDLEWTGIPDERIKWPWTPGAEAYSISFSGYVDGVLRGVGIELPLPNDAATSVLHHFLRSHYSVFHNAQGDLIWLTHLGFSVILAGDPMLLASLLDEGQSLALEVLATSKTNMVPNWKSPVWPKRPTTEEDWERLFAHNIGDCDAALLLLQALLKEVAERPEPERTNIMRLYKELLLPAVPMFVDMALNGVPIDAEGLRQTIEEAKAKALTLSRELGEMAGLMPRDAEDVAMSNVKTPRLLQSKFGLNVVGSSEVALEVYQHERPVELIQGIRHERKFLGTYLEPWHTLAERDGRLRSIYRLTGVRTGRTSAELGGLNGKKKGGSIQVAPREERVRKQVRAREGWKIVAADQSAAELRGVAWIANERTMIRLFREGADLHLRTAMETDKAATLRTAQAIAQLSDPTDFNRSVEIILDVGPSEILKRFPEWKELRQKAKGTNFGLCFGAGVETYMNYCRREYGVVMTYDEAAAARTAYFALYSDVKPWHQRAVEEWQRLGHVTTPLGRYRRHLTEGTQAINMPVQSVMSDVVVLSMIEIRREFNERKLRSLLGAFAHDNVIVEAPEDETEIVKQILEYHLANPPLQKFGISELPVPLVAEAHIADTWAS